MRIMRKGLVLLGLIIGFAMLSGTVFGAVFRSVSYCTNIDANDTYISVTDDIWFTNSSLHNYACFYPSDAVGNPANIFTNNVTINLMGHTVYANESHPDTITGVYGYGATNWTIINGTFDFTYHAAAGYGLQFPYLDNADMYLENVTVRRGIGSLDTGIIVSWASAKRLTVYNSTFTGATTYDLDLELPQSEIISCDNEWDTSRPAHSLLSKDACSDPPASYKDYIVQVNCTQSSSASYGALACSNNIPIPADCVNITTSAWTVLTMQDEGYLNSSFSFTRYTCNPEGDRTTYCDNLYRTCEYIHVNAYPSREWDTYAAGGNATSFHAISIPDGCLINAAGNFTMIGRLHLACKSFTESGISIDEQAESCTHILTCYNSGTMEERFSDCTSILTPCVYGCVEGVCQSVSTTTLPSGEGSGSFITFPFASGAWISMLFTPFSLITFVLVGVGVMLESQVKDAKGTIFLAVIMIGVLMFTYLELYPLWIGVLIVLICAVLLSKAMGFDIGLGGK